jgi:hypothetical protein
MISDKVRPHHLQRKAILYVRQSSAHQVLHNREASIRTDLAHPSIVRKAGRRSFVISIAIAPRCTQDESLGSCRRSALLSQGRDSELRAFSVFHLFHRPVHNIDLSARWLRLCARRAAGLPDVGCIAPSPTEPMMPTVR